MVIWNGARQVTYGPNDLHDNVGYNPWVGHTVTGWPETVILRGEIIVESGKCLAAPGQGRWIPQPGLSETTKRR